MALGQDTRDYVVRGIGFQNDIQGRVEVLKDRGGTKVGLKFLKHLLTGRCPFDRGIISTLYVGNRSRVITFDGF